MRILFVNASGADSTYGGAEHYVALLAERLEERGHEVRLMSAFPIRDETAARTISLHRVDWRESPIRRYRNHLGDVAAIPWPRFEPILAQTRPDLVHTNNLPGISTGIWESARRAAIPVVHTLHDYQLLCPRTSLTRRDGSACYPSPLLCGLRTRRLARWAPAVGAVIGVSDHVLRRHWGFFPRETPRTVIRAAMIPIPEGDRRPPSETLRNLGFLGALTTDKGVELLLDAAPSLARAGVRLRIAGDGPLRDAVVGCEHVEYAGRLEGEALTAFLTSCDAGVVPSLWEEPGPIVLREWLSAGRPALATRYGGLAEVSSLDGVLQFDPTAAALVELAGELRDEHRWHELLSHTAAVHDDSDVQRWTDQHEAAYETALHGKARALSR